MFNGKFYSIKYNVIPGSRFVSDVRKNSLFFKPILARFCTKTEKKKIIFIPTKYRQKNILVVDTLLSFILTHPSVLEKSYSAFHA